MREIKKPLQKIDWRLTHKLRGITQHRVAGVFFRGFAHAGDSLVVVPLLLIWWVAIGIDQYRYFFPLWGSLILASLFTVLFKFSFRRNRPTGGNSGFHRKADPYSFPSGHAVRCFNLAACVTIAYTPVGGLFLWIWAATVSAGRVIQGIHYVSDVIAGALLGIVIAVITTVLILSGIIPAV